MSNSRYVCDVFNDFLFLFLFTNYDNLLLHIISIFVASEICIFLKKKKWVNLLIMNFHHDFRMIPVYCHLSANY